MEQLIDSCKNCRSAAAVHVYSSIVQTRLESGALDTHFSEFDSLGIKGVTKDSMLKICKTCAILRHSGSDIKHEQTVAAILEKCLEVRKP